MNTLQDLRDSLGAHAEAVSDTASDALADRSASIRARIRRSRNRRRGALAGGVAVAVLAAGGVYAATTAPDPHHSSGPIIAGHTVPESVRVTGFEYRLTSAVQSRPGQQQFTVRLPKVTPERVVELVGTGLGRGSATLREADTDLARVGAGSRTASPVAVGSDKHAVSVVLRGADKDARVGLAVYVRDQSLPRGIDDGTAVFRQDIGARHLLGGVWAERGQRSASFTVTGPVRRWSLSDACAFAGRDLSLNVMLEERVDGKLYADTGCETLAHRDLDPGTGGSTSDQMLFNAGPHTISLRLVDGAGHPLHATQVSGAVFGAAVYSLGAQSTVQGLAVDHRIEANGRDWVLDQTIPADNVQITGPAYVDAVVGPGDWRPVGQHLTTGDRDMMLGEMANQAGQVGGFSLGEVLSGSTYRFWLKHAKAPAAAATILVYRPAG